MRGSPREVALAISLEKESHLPGGHVGAARMERQGAFWEVGTEYAKA